MKPLFDMLEQMSSVTEWTTQEGNYEVPVKGWNLPASFKDCIEQEFREWYDEDNLTIEIVKKKEMAYSCARYFDGQDAKDEGHTYWLNYHESWKQGRGKVTLFTVKVTRCANVEN